MDLGLDCPVCGKHDPLGKHKCNKRTERRWVKRQLDREREIAEESSRSVEDEIEYQALIQRQFN